MHFFFFIFWNEMRFHETASCLDVIAEIQCCAFVIHRSLWLTSVTWEEERVRRVQTDSRIWMELLSHAVKGGANKMSVTARANRMLSLSPFIKNSCYLKSLYPQHFFILSFEDLFFLHSFTRSLLFQQYSHTRTVTPSFECESDCLSMHCSRLLVLHWIYIMSRWMFFFSFQMC